jgi:hypothetical protein
MNKLHPKTEEGILVVVTLFILVSSMLDATVSIILAIASLSVVVAYNQMTKKQ